MFINKLMLKIPISLILIVLAVETNGQQREDGPVIDSFGYVFAVERPDFTTDLTIPYKVVFDIHSTPKSPDDINPEINTLARFLNMHAQVGVPLDSIEVAAVFHGEASTQTLADGPHLELFGVTNPNLPLLRKLQRSGAQLVLCGQSMYARDIDRADLDPGVQVALSAMTTIVSFQSQGFVLIRF
ncbi:MAG: DsrE family protein [Saprospiraceae bacterium]|nr:DsrE family protein [Saprospiraceae bacterium]